MFHVAAAALAAVAAAVDVAAVTAGGTVPLR